MAELRVGDQLRLTTGVWDDGEDFTGWIARSGDLVEVNGFRGQAIIVNHPRSNKRFLVWKGDFVREESEN